MAYRGPDRLRHRHQLFRPADAAGRDHGDPARHPDLEHAVLAAAGGVPARLRGDVRRRRQTDGRARHAQRVSASSCSGGRWPAPATVSRRGFGMLAVSRFLLGMGEGGGFPAATKAVAEWFPVARALDCDGHHQRRHRRRRGDRAAAHRAGAGATQLALGVLSFRRCRPGLGRLVVARLLAAGASSAPADSRTRAPAAESSRPSARAEAAAAWLRLLRASRGLGPGRRQVSERRRLVFLSVLAAEISLRRARLRHQSRSATYAWIPYAASGVGCLVRRLVLELADPARPLAQLRAQDRARPERRRHAVDHASSRTRRWSWPSSSSASRSSASNRGPRW